MRRPADLVSSPRVLGSASDPPRAAAGALALLTVAFTLGCTGARPGANYRYPHQAAYGRTSTCPDVRMPPLRDGNVSTDAARCSYADANGARVTHLAGKVLAEGGPGDPGTGLPDVAVTVHATTGPVFNVESPGPVIAHAITDAQGSYSLRGVFVAGDYAIVVREPTGERITERVIRVEPDAVGSLRDLRVLVPIDPRLRADAAQPPTPSADPRLQPTPVPPITSPTTTPPTTTPAAPEPATTRPKPRAGLRLRPPARVP